MNRPKKYLRVKSPITDRGAYYYAGARHYLKTTLANAHKSAATPHVRNTLWGAVSATHLHGQLNIIGYDELPNEDQYE